MKNQSSAKKAFVKYDKPFKKTLTKSDLFTGGKSAELAVFYNIAYFRIAGFINFLLGNSYEKDKSKLEAVFTGWLNNIRQNKEHPAFKPHTLSYAIIYGKVMPLIKIHQAMNLQAPTFI